MVNYPTILGLPQEDIDRQLYVGVLGLESRVKALENKPKPTPTQTGTVTVTATVDDGEEQYPMGTGMVVLATAPVDWDKPDYSTFVAAAQTFDETGTATLALVGGQSTDIPFGTYYLCAADIAQAPTSEYSGTLTVDGDEEVTITLIPIDGGDD